MRVPWTYETLKGALRGRPLPAMLVDLRALDRNVARLAGLSRAHGKTLRVASKSVRVPALLRRILDAGAPTTRGLMTFSAQETRFLAEQGFDDLLVAYPTTQRADLDALRALCAQGTRVSLVVDEPAHLAAIHDAWSDDPAPALPVVVEMDVSYRPAGLAHLGARRSPLLDVEAFERMLDAVLAEKHVTFGGVMAYEAQVAGVPDARSAAVRAMKRLSVPDVARKRAAVARALERRGLRADVFNAGGTGSLATSAAEACVTEVTAGSGFLQSHLFDGYRASENEPALVFALPVTRVPAPGLATCHGGGFIASGAVGPEKAPVPVLPEGVATLATEGFGEVQTPLRVPAGVRLAPGDPVFFRPAKAGEIAERFAEYLLLQDGEVVGSVPTYRGLGRCFH